MFAFATILIIAVTFLVAGTVKGAIGLGLPSISLAVLMVTVDLHSAMALLLVPSIVTSVWQGTTGSSILPGVMFLQVIGLSRDVMIQAMGILFALSAMALRWLCRGTGC